MVLAETGALEWDECQVMYKVIYITQLHTVLDLGVIL